MSKLNYGVEHFAAFPRLTHVAGNLTLGRSKRARRFSLSQDNKQTQKKERGAYDEKNYGHAIFSDCVAKTTVIFLADSSQIY